MPVRRTQAERSTATKASLLEATIECLAEFGYAEATTTRIVDRAGVSRGAQVHHFPTKAELEAEAVRQIASKRSQEMLDQLSAVDHDNLDDRLSEMLEVVWELHKSALGTASLELFAAARTNPDLRVRIRDVEREIGREALAAIIGLFPGQADNRMFRDAIGTSLAALHGLALLGFLSSGEGLERRWPATRQTLVTMMRSAMS